MKWGINWKVLSEQTDKGFSVPTVQSTNHLCCSRRNYESHIFVSDAAPPPLPPPAPHTRSSITGTYIQICRPGLPAFSSLASVLNHIAALFELITRTNNAPLCSSCAVYSLQALLGSFTWLVVLMIKCDFLSPTPPTVSAAQPLTIRDPRETVSSDMGIYETRPTPLVLSGTVLLATLWDFKHCFIHCLIWYSIYLSIYLIFIWVASLLASCLYCLLATPASYLFI